MAVGNRNLTAVRLRGSLEGDVDSRVTESAGRPSVIARDLERYYALLDRSLPRLAENEAMLVCDVINGRLYGTPGFSPSVWLVAEIEDAFKLNNLDKKWDVDADEFRAKLERLSPVEALALIDAAERFWARASDYEDTLVAIREIFRIKS